jgi:hypothetical protein
MYRWLGPLKILCLLLALFGSPAQAVIIASGDGTGNTIAPADDPGWANVVQVGLLTGVYLGSGWVLTANHAAGQGGSNVTIGGAVYEPVVGSKVQLETGAWNADLALFQVARDPGLPDVAIRSSLPPQVAEVVMIGLGKNRGAATRTCFPPRDGWLWGPGRAMRWGTNAVHDNEIDFGISGTVTRAFSTRFDVGPSTPHEAQAASGDSGGAVFIKNGATWELAGIMTAINSCAASTAVDGDLTYAADLSYYRDQIDALASVPACDDGLDQDGDGLVDYPDDPGCDDLQDPFETSDALPCDDGIDNDGDGLTDFPNDLGCASPTWALEDPQCSDDVNNDGDGLIDWDGGGVGDPDPQCLDAPYRNREAPNKGCGLGLEIAVLLPLLMAGARRRQMRRVSPTTPA